MEAEAEGLHALANTDTEDRLADIVFVHGLGGDSVGTWSFSTRGKPDYFFWPSELGRDLPKCGIWSVGFPAGITAFGDPGTIIEKRAGNIAHKLVNGGIGARPLIFITHSMGGLIVKSLVVDSQIHADPDRKAIEASVAGIVFCGTPHRGAALASAVTALGMFFGGAQSHVKQMCVHADQLDLLHDQFIEWHRRRGIAISSYAESHPLKKRQWKWLRPVPFPLVVPRSSANPNIAGHEVRDIDSDHFSLVKPKGRREDIYVGVLRFVRSVLEKLDKRLAPTATSPPTSTATAVAPPRLSTKDLIDRFQGADPIAGNEALVELLERGDEAQALLLENARVVLGPTQVMRRWQKYVVARHAQMSEAIEAQLLERPGRITARFAPLLAGLAPSPIRHKVFTAIDARFERAPDDSFHIIRWDRDALDALLSAYGYSGGDTYFFWTWVTGSQLAWEKLSVQAFRSACASLALCGEGHDWVAQFVSEEFSEDTPAVAGRRTRPIAADNDLDQNRISSAELSTQAVHGAFGYWQRGQVADLIIRDWSRHEHWRVRRFGAEVLTHFRFKRFEPGLRHWLERESDEEAKRLLKMGIARIELESSLPNGWLELSQPDSEGDTPADPEVVVTLARFGVRHAGIKSMCQSTDWYQRATGVLAAAYLRDLDLIGSPTTALKEASNHFERALLGAAFAIAEVSIGTMSLHALLVNASSNQDPYFDVRFLHRFLQIAIGDGLRASGKAEETSAWEAEFMALSDG